MTTIWHNPRCSKSRQTLALLREMALSLKFVTIVVTRRLQPNCTQFWKCLGLALRAYFEKVRRRPRNWDCRKQPRTRCLRHFSHILHLSSARLSFTARKPYWGVRRKMCIHFLVRQNS